jgi:hypothetical protein
MLGALVLRLPGLRAIVSRCGAQLGTSNFSSLAPALARASSLHFVQRLIERLCANSKPSRGELIAVDSMALSLPKTRRHACAKMNNNTVGVGVLWSLRLGVKKKGQSPIQIHRIIDGAWHDSTLIKSIAFIARGPIYLMDRGFYAFAALNHLLAQKVNFVMRARKRSLVYQALKTVSPPRRFGALTLTEDALVRLGASRAKSHPKLRLLRAHLASGEELILVSNLLTADAEELFAHYKKRWQIERFHRLLKETLGLAHLYSFKRNGLLFLLHVAVLLALLLILGHQKSPRCNVLEILLETIKSWRRELHLENPWKRNIHTKRKTKKCT